MQFLFLLRHRQALEHCVHLDLVASELLKPETIDAQTFNDVLKQSPVGAG